MADELKRFRVYFTNGHSIIVRAHSFNYGNGAFFKAEGEHDPDIYVRIGEVLAIVPEVKTPTPELPGTTGSMSW